MITCQLKNTFKTEDFWLILTISLDIYLNVTCYISTLSFRFLRTWLAHGKQVYKNNVQFYQSSLAFHLSWPIFLHVSPWPFNCWGKLQDVSVAKSIPLSTCLGKSPFKNPTLVCLLTFYFPCFVLLVDLILMTMNIAYTNPNTLSLRQCASPQHSCDTGEKSLVSTFFLTICYIHSK